MTAIQLELTGPPRARPAGLVEGLPLPARDAILLAWLALEGPTSRMTLARLLWPHSAPEVARGSLRQRLFRLKKLCGDDLVTGQASLRLAAGVDHDLEGAESLLHGTDVDVAGDLALWLQQQRERLAQRGRERLEREMQAAERAQDGPRALSCAQALLARDPRSEAAHRHVMRLHYLAGDRAAALLAFDHCEEVLKHEVGTRPAPETLALLATIQDATEPVPSRTTPAALQRPPRVVGREDALCDIAEAWQGHLRVLVLGEPGIGKSRLLEAAAAGLPARAPVCLARARPGDEVVPLALLRRLLPALPASRSAGPGDDAGEARARLAQRLDELGVPASSAAEPGGAPATARDPADAARRPAERPVPKPLLPVLLQALAPLAAEGAALILDDWQFADTASVELLSEAMDRPEWTRLRVAIASRTDAGPVADARIEHLRLRSDVRTVPLGPLDGPAAEALYASLGMGQAGHAAASAAALRRVGGNPLFLLEALRELLRDDAGPAGQALPLPRQVRVLVGERLSRLPEKARQLVHLAAVAGSDFDITLAEAVTGQHALALAEPWSQLEQQGLLCDTGIVHDLHGEVALAQLPRPIAALLHARVAAWLETRPHEPARLAAHWRAARQDERAVPHLVAAARLAWLASRPAELHDLYSQAAGIETQAGRRAHAFELWFDAVEALTECGRLEQAQRCAEALSPLATTEGERLRVRFVDAALRSLYGDTAHALREVGAMLADAIALGDHRVEAQCRLALAQQAVSDGRFDDAVQHLAAGERVLRDAGEERQAIALAASIGLAQGLRGRPRLALVELTRMLPLLEAVSDRPTRTVVRAAKAVQHLRCGEMQAALTQAELACDDARQTVIATPNAVAILCHLVEVYAGAGRFDLALGVVDETTSRLRDRGDAVHAIDTVADLYLTLGRADLAHLWRQPMASGAPALARERSRVALLDFKQALLMGTPAAPVPALLASLADAGEDLALAAEWTLWLGLRPDGPTGHVPTLAATCHAASMNLVLPALRALQRSLPGEAPAAAMPPATAEPGAQGIYTPWCALFGAREALRAGQPQMARARVQEGLDWLQKVAAAHLPPAFHDSFVNRHPLSRALWQLRSAVGATLPTHP